MNEEQSADFIISAIVVTREDISRAKQWVLIEKGLNVSELVEQWLEQQHMTLPNVLNADGSDYEGALRNAAKSYSARLAFYQALWELISAGDLFPSGPAAQWSAKSISYRTSRLGSGIDLDKLTSSHPEKIERPFLAPVVSADVDIFLKGIGVPSLDSGIHEAIEQSLVCFRRGLYFPSTVMLAAAAEAAWTEMGVAFAKRISDSKLEALVGDEVVGIARKVSEIKKATENDTAAKPILAAANKSKHDIGHAETWTTVLRDRRNALHWGKAKSFVADHSETAALPMAAQLHLATLESIRLAC